MHQSGLEAARCTELHLMQAGGLILELEAHPQPQFRLEVNGQAITTYRADFRYIDSETEETVVEDTKGMKTREYELKRKLMRGRREKASRGYVPCGHAAFGFRWSEQQADGKRIRAIEPHPEEGPIVTEIFRSYLRIQSLKMLREYLIIQGHTNRSGDFFSVEALRVLLHNPVYKGVVKYGSIEEKGKHELLISDVIFGRVRAALKRNRRRLQPKRPMLYDGRLPPVSAKSLRYWGSPESRTRFLD